MAVSAITHEAKPVTYLADLLERVFENLDDFLQDLGANFRMADLIDAYSASGHILFTLVNIIQLTATATL
jgi:hypothetical protein